MSQYEEDKSPLSNSTLQDFFTIVAAGVSVLGLGLSGWFYTFSTSIPPGTKHVDEAQITALLLLLFSALAAGRVVWGILKAIRNRKS